MMFSKTISSSVRATLARSARVVAGLAPDDVRRFLRFVYRLPVHYAEDLSYQRACDAGVGVAVIFPANGIQIVLPSDRIAHSVLTSFFFERATSREWKAFLELAEGCRSFVDVGASGGSFSCLFAASRNECEVLSIEPDPPSLDALQDVRSLNSGPSVKRWIIDPRGIGDAPREVVFLSNGYGAEVLVENGNNLTRAFAGFNRREAKEMKVQMDTFESICRSHDFHPDIVKIDIESYEHELILSSRSFLEERKPRMHLELHIRALRERGLDPRLPLDVLEKIGYRVFQGGSPSQPLSTVLPDVERQEVIRLDLLCS